MTHTLIPSTGTKFPVDGINLVVAYKEVKMFTLLPKSYPTICNYSRFLDDVFHKWLENFDSEPFYNLMENLNLDLKSNFESTSKSLNLLDINIQIVENNLVLIFFINEPSHLIIKPTRAVIHHTQITIYHSH